MIKCACGLLRAQDDLVMQATGREVLIFPRAPGKQARLMVCRGCRAVYALTLDESLQLPKEDPNAPPELEQPCLACGGPRDEHDSSPRCQGFRKS